MWLLVLIALIIVGLAVFGIVAAFLAVAFAVISYLFPVLLIVGGAWLLMKAAAGADERHRARRDARADRPGLYRPMAASVARRPVQQRPLVRPQAGPPRRELPLDVEIKADQIRHKVNVLLGYADRFPPFSRDLYIVRQTAAEYLPRTIAAYLAVPGTNDPIVHGTGRTALQELRAQLAMLDSSLDEITQNLQRQDLDGLMANRRFLEERFGMEDGGEMRSA
jgi:hypothetical protein